MTGRFKTLDEAVTHSIRQDLYKKQSEHAHNTYWALHSINSKEQRAHAAAMRRNEKSLALLASKLLCQHQLYLDTTGTRTNVFKIIRCSVCKVTTRTQ